MSIMTRYEGVVLLVSILITDLIRHIVRGNFSFSHLLLLYAKRIGVVAVILVPWAIWKISYYGTLIPHSFIFKNLPDNLYYAPRPMAVLWFFFTYYGIPIVFSVLFLILGYRVILREKPASLILSVFAVLFVVSVLVGPFSDYGRYALPVVPVFYLMTGAMLSLRIKPFSKTILVAGVTVMIILAVSIVGLFRTAMHWKRMNLATQLRKEASGLVCQEVDPRCRVLSGNLGVIGWYCDTCDIIDTYGLCDIDILQARMNGTQTKRIWDRRPNYVIDNNFRDEYMEKQKLKTLIEQGLVTVDIINEYYDPNTRFNLTVAHLTWR